MPRSSSLPSQPDPLQPVLDDAEAELRRRLHEACEAEAKGLSTDSTHEIRRLEDNLLAAAVAAEQTISMRRYMKNRTPAERERPISISEAPTVRGTPTQGLIGVPKNLLVSTARSLIPEFANSLTSVALLGGHGQSYQV